MNKDLVLSRDSRPFYRCLAMYDNVCVIAGGKTGSTTLKQSVLDLYRAKGFPMQSLRDRTIYSHSPLDFEALVERATPEKRALVLTSFRDPITRHVSSLFHNLHLHIPAVNNIGLPIQRVYQQTKEWMDQKLDERVYFEAYHPVPLPPCRVESAYFHVTSSIDILYLRHDKIARWEDHLQIVLPDIKIAPSNLSSEKIYHGLYQYFCANYKNPKFADLVEHERSIWSKYYTEEEMEEILRRWV